VMLGMVDEYLGHNCNRDIIGVLVTIEARKAGGASSSRRSEAR
jgi:hypothetical protein